jgi:DNA repair protein RecN (Recombination protein N)
MLQHLSISNFVLIDQCSLDFSAGLCVFTGETGAGKSILLDALGLVLGARSSGSVLRDAKKPATITAQFTLTPVIAAQLEEAGIETADDALLLKRVLTPEGTSKALVNDQAVSLSLLKSLGDQLVEIHGQHGQRDLTDMSIHRNLLDIFGGHQKKREELRTRFAAWQGAKESLAETQRSIAEARREEEYLRHVSAELSKLAPEEGEEETLAAERARCMKAEQLGSLLHEALKELQSSQAIHHTQRMLMRSDAASLPELQPAIEGLERAQIELDEIQRHLEAQIEAFGYDPQKLEQVEERLFALRAAARKHQTSVSELPALLARIKESLSNLQSQESLLRKHLQAASEAKKHFLELAETLAVKREKAAEKLAKAVMTELSALKMSATRFQAKLENLSEDAWNETGTQRVCFEVSTNPGSPFGALHKIASGGELSRFMLALKVVLAKHKSDTTLIFDEIDAGTSGMVADAIGDRLALLGKTQQVMVITHLPQVAGKGSSHFKVAKEQSARTTRTMVVALNAKERQEELAQMLSGKEITAEARKAAARLLI